MAGELQLQPIRVWLVSTGFFMVLLWFAKMADGIQIKELADPPDFVCARMILTSCCAC
jgi:hypothetical protein